MMPQSVPASIPVEWVTIPSGNTVTGSTDAQVAAAHADCISIGQTCPDPLFERESPQGTVFVNQFDITKFEITNAQYHECVLAGVCQAARTDLDGEAVVFEPELADPDRPVVGVSAIGASIYCREWLGGRLPHGEEWTRAARGEDGRVYPWGDAYDPAIANLSGETISRADSHPDGASPFGVFQMAGNVWEWTDQDVRLAGNMPPRIVVRGGGWNSLPFEARVAYLGEALNPSDARFDIGIRCVRGASDDTSIVQQTEPIGIRFEQENGELRWMVTNAETATITCYTVLGRKISGSWDIAIGVEGTAAIPDTSVTCSLVATGYDGSTDASVLTFESRPTICPISPASVFESIYPQYAADLGCAVEELTTIPTIAEQPFQGGHMLWRSDTNGVYVVFVPAGQWESNPEWVWDGSNPDGVGLSSPPGLLEPKRGFGWLWRTHLGAETGELGWATAPEQGFDNTGQIQVFEGGLLVKGNGPAAFVLLNSDRR